MFLLACNDAVHVGPKLFREFLSSVRLDPSGESKIWNKCAVEFALQLLSLISGSYTARNRDFHLLYSSRAQKEGRSGPEFG